MKYQLKTIREALQHGIKAINHLGGAREAMPLHDAMPALTQLEAMVGEQEPVAKLHDDGYWTPMKTEAGRALNDRLMRAGSPSIEVYTAAPVAQQPQAETDNHEAQGQLEFLDKKNNALSAAIRKVMARLADLLDEDQFKEIEEIVSFAGVQPQAEAVPVVDRVYEAAKRLVDHADFQLGGVLSAKSKARDIPSNAASKVKARHLASLRDALAKAPQQAEAVQACGHSMSLLLRSAESNEPLYCEACDDKSGRHDAERRETELLDANRRLQEKIASADALKLHAIEELCQLGYTVKDGELFPPDHLHKLMEAAGHPLAAPQQAEAVPTDTERAYLIGFADGKQAQQAEAVRVECHEVIAGVTGNTVRPRELTEREHNVLMRALVRSGKKVEAPQQAEAVPSDVARDAERYRWLRDQTTDDGIAIVMKNKCINDSISYAENINKHIDAAISQQKGGV